MHTHKTFIIKKLWNLKIQNVDVLKFSKGLYHMCDVMYVTYKKNL